MTNHARSVRNILIVNLHSALNLGDDAINHATVALLRTTFPAAHITFAANHPESWQHYTGIHRVSSLATWGGNSAQGQWRKNAWKFPFYLLFLALCALLYRLSHYQLFFGTEAQKRLLSAYYQADLVLSCGGGNFYANRKISPAFLWALSAIAFATALGKKTLMLPQSIGPIEGAWQKRVARLVFNRVDQIMLREKISLHFAQDVLKVTAPLCLLPDLAFGLPSVAAEDEGKRHPAEPESEGDSFGQKNTEVTRIAITPMNRGAQDQRFTAQAAYEAMLLLVAQKISERRPVQWLIVAQCHGPSADQDDRIVARRLVQAFADAGELVELYEPVGNLQHLLAIFAQCDCIIGTRMHSAILGLTQKTPVVLIGYQPKAQGVMEMVEMGHYSIPIAHAETEMLLRLVRNVLAQRPAIAEQITEQSTRWQQQFKQLAQQLQALV